MKSRKSNRKNQKPGFYSKVLSEAEKLEFEEAVSVEGIDDEIAVLRMKISCLLKEEPTNLRLLLAADDLLHKMVNTQYRMTHEQKKGLKDALETVVRDIALPIGVTLLRK
jgi:hypothetical protein